MKIDVEPGVYVVAVSGGVDSVVLLNVLAKQSQSLPGKDASKHQWRLVVAHFDHGIREDSGEDRLFVQALAKKYELPFVFDEGHLGAGASENEARIARYRFLRRVQQAAGAQAVITAHHEDDVLETAILNMLRGTARHGLASLRSRPDLLRPFLDVSKATVKEYAEQNKLEWHEDKTNDDIRYLRNYVRQKVLPRFSATDRAQLLKHIDDIAGLNQDIDEALSEHLAIHAGNKKLDRQWFIMLPHAVARDTMASWLKQECVDSYDKKLLEKLLVGCKTLAPGKRIDVDKTHVIQIEKHYLALVSLER